MKEAVLQLIQQKYKGSQETTMNNNMPRNKVEEMDKFLETYNLQSLNCEKIENMNRLIVSKEIESVIKSLPTSKVQTRKLHW